MTCIITLPYGGIKLDMTKRPFNSKSIKMFRYLFILTLSLALPACVTIGSGSEDAEFKVVDPIRPGTADSVINFYHPIGLEDLPVPLNGGYPAPNIPIFFKANNLYQIWDADGLVGFLPVANRCFQLRVKPGRQRFIGRFVRWNAGNWTVLEGDVAAGKTYFIKVSQRWNTWKPSVSFEALEPDGTSFNEVSACKVPFAYDRTSGKSAEFWDHHVTENIGDVRTVFDNLNKGSRDYYFDHELKPENGQ